MHDQALRLIASGLGPREAAETVYVPGNLRDRREGYGQVESHVRQVYNGNIGWFDGDVYEINPLSVREEAERTVQAMGGRARRCRKWPRRRWPTGGSRTGAGHSSSPPCC